MMPMAQFVPQLLYNDVFGIKWTTILDLLLNKETKSNQTLYIYIYIYVCVCVWVCVCVCVCVMCVCVCVLNWTLKSEVSIRIVFFIM